MARASYLGCIAILCVGCSGLISPDENRLDPDNAVDSGRRDMGRSDGGTDGNTPDGARPDSGEGDCVGDGDCNDGVDCTLDVCVSGFCQFTPDDTRCSGDDPNPCTASVYCERTLGCQDVPIDCDDGVACTDDRCDVGASGCVYSSTCEDGETCDPALGCSGGGCTSDADCADDDACTQDRCVGGMCQRPSTTCPSPGNPCQTVACNPDTGDCDASNVADGTPCPDDGNLCTTGEACMDGECRPRGATTCGTSDGNPCMGSICDGATGLCVPTPAPGGTPCDDGDDCTMGTSCDGSGTCGGGAGCQDDGNPCTDERCTDSGCISEASNDDRACPSATGATAGTCCGATCADLDTDQRNCGSCGNDCGDALCIDGACAECDDDTDCPVTSPCFVSSCQGGFCNFEVDDGFCFIGGTCVDDGDLDPTNQCLVCDPDRSQESYVPNMGAACSDGRFCTLVPGTPDPDGVGMDRCTNDGRCVGMPRSCPGDGNACTREACNEDMNACVSINRDPCTLCCGTGGLGSCCAASPGSTSTCQAACPP